MSVRMALESTPLRGSSASNPDGLPVVYESMLDRVPAQQRVAVNSQLARLSTGGTARNRDLLTTLPAGGTWAPASATAAAPT
jgi:hypothetical protein